MNKIWWFVGIGGVLAIISAVFFNFLQQSETDFSFDSDVVREIENFGVDSSGMRINLGYSVDPNSYNPRYINGPENCVITASLTNSSSDGEASEEQQTSDMIAVKLQLNSNEVQNSFLDFDSNTGQVPVKSGLNSTEEQAGFGRVFSQESLVFMVIVDCEDEATLRNVFPRVLESFRFVDTGSKY